MATLPPSLIGARIELYSARRATIELRKKYDELKEETAANSDEELSEPDRQKQYRLVSLGIELSCKKLEEIQLERKLVFEERDAGVLDHGDAQERDRGLIKRSFSVGKEQWEYAMKKMRLEETGPIRLGDPDTEQFSKGLVCLFEKVDALKQKSYWKRDKHWRQHTIEYYDGESNDGIWCHLSGTWLKTEFTTAAPIVPHFVDPDAYGEILFGSRVHSLDQPSNSLLMSSTIKSWFDKYLFVIVPVDIKEEPIRRWKSELLSPSIKKSEAFRGFTGSMLHQRELSFRNQNRPASRFLYFHFLMSLIRSRDNQQSGWEDVWSRYHDHRPFPTPSPYMRKSMLLALANQFNTTAVSVLESWIHDHGFEPPLKLSDAENTEATRQVRETVENIAESDEDSDDDDSDDEESEDWSSENGDSEDGSEDESEDESEDGSEDGERG